MCRTLKELKVLRPLFFEGKIDPIVANTWLRKINRLLDNIEISNLNKVVLESCMLERKVVHWWDFILRLRGTEVDEITWDKFEEVFMEKYFSISIQDQIEAQFLAWFQGSISVVDYEAKFSELAHYAPYLVKLESRRTKRFVHDLRLFIHRRLIALVFHYYGESYERSLVVELEMEETKALKDQRVKKLSNNNHDKKRKQKEK